MVEPYGGALASSQLVAVTLAPGLRAIDLAAGEAGLLAPRAPCQRFPGCFREIECKRLSAVQADPTLQAPGIKGGAPPPIRCCVAAWSCALEGSTIPRRPPTLPSTGAESIEDGSPLAFEILLSSVAHPRTSKELRVWDWMDLKARSMRSHTSSSVHPLSSQRLAMSCPAIASR